MSSSTIMAAAREMRTISGFLRHFVRLEAQLEEMGGIERMVADLESQRSTAEASLAEINNRIEGASKSLESKTAEVDAALDQRRQEIEREIERSKAKVARANEKASKIEAEADARRVQADAEIAEARARADAIVAEATERARQIDTQLTQEANQRVAEHRRIDAQLSAKRTLVSDEEAKLAKVRSEIERLRSAFAGG